MYQYRLYIRVLFSLVTLLSLTATAKENEFYFDASLLRNSGLSSSDLQKLNEDALITPGSHSLDIYLNGTFITRYGIEFSQRGTNVEPCLPHALVAMLRFKSLPEKQPASCYWPDDHVMQGVRLKFDLAQLRMDVSVPQALLKSSPRGAVSEESLDAGESMLFINYMANQYHATSRRYKTSKMDSSWVNLNGGINLGLWRYRQQSSLNYSNIDGSHWNTSRRYIQRAIYPLRSEMTLGEGYTDGQLFSGISFRGIQLTSDTRMLPDSLRGYAPVVRGIAKTNAKVTVMQDQTTLYETTVAPGPFVIDDLYPTYYSGDLTIVVTEADGSKNIYNMPYSSLAESIRPGVSQWSFTAGKVQNIDAGNTFSEMIWRQGLTNALTFNVGNQLASGYMAWSLGGVYSSAIGAVGLNSFYSLAQQDDGNRGGWMLRLNYSKALPQTGTLFTLAASRYAAQGYAELYDTLGSRHAQGQGQQWQSPTWKQRSRIEFAASQPLASFGNINASASMQDYSDGKQRDKQYQLSWNKLFDYGVSLSVTAARTYSITPGVSNNADVFSFRRQMQTMWSFSLSTPLGQRRTSPTLSTNVNHTTGNGGSDGGYQSTLSGIYGEHDPLNYSLNFSANKRMEQAGWGANLQRSFPYVNAATSWSTSSNYWQASASLQGAIVAHKSGVTLGQWVGDSFALIDAPGASGAEVIGGQNARVDAFGYAITPALGAYQINHVTLDPGNMDDNVELQTMKMQVAPYAGATVRLRFNTLQGQAMLITAARPDNASIPMGTSVYDGYGNRTGMVGQANQIYLRSHEEKGELQVQWGNRTNERCRIAWHAPSSQEPLALLTLPCR
ncbi:fimbria/pilus outer membrane usher protein [Kosakonia sp.]|uniref:fimbria/pilus outer membrane usher protein n=1 Tax=Kosakonia sp. TaxID=1916651 RepID=UPI0028A17DFC|nr:fimbria/pilus outer membrane usher protein [Kosakonia sp.]